MTVYAFTGLWFGQSKIQLVLYFTFNLRRWLDNLFSIWSRNSLNVMIL